MNLGSVLIDELEEARSAGRLPAAVDEPVWVVGVNAAVAEADVTQLDGLGLAFTRLVVWSTPGDVVDVADWLDRLGQAIVGRITYLGEPLALLERDGRLRRALIRSAQPFVTADGIEYSEGWLEFDPAGKRVAFSLSRYQQSDGEVGRRPAETIVTRQVFGRLVGDLEALLSPAA